MILKRVLDYAHELIKQAVKEGDIVIDGTCGNGHDTLLLSELVGDQGHVYGFDIQKEAIMATNNRLEENQVADRVSLIQDSHAHLDKHIPAQHLTNIQAAIFNLGYLPGSDKSVVTTPEQTTASLDRILTSLHKGGLIVLVVYHGHPGGKEEKEALHTYVRSLDQKSVNVLQYGFINQKNNPPFILAIEKK